MIINIISNEKDLFKHAGGSIENFISKCKMVHAKRVFSLEKEHKFIITIEDMKAALEMIKKQQVEDKDDGPPPGMYM